MRKTDIIEKEKISIIKLASGGNIETRLDLETKLSHKMFGNIINNVKKHSCNKYNLERT